MSRSWTTLTTAIIDFLLNSVCLSNPYWQDNLFLKDNINELIQQVKKILSKSPIEDQPHVVYL